VTELHAPKRTIPLRDAVVVPNDATEPDLGQIGTLTSSTRTDNSPCPPLGSFKDHEHYITNNCNIRRKR